MEGYTRDCTIFASGNVSIIDNRGYISGKVVSISGKVQFISGCCKEESIIGKLESIIGKVLLEKERWKR